MKFQKCHMRRFVQAMEKLGFNLISSVFVIIFSFILFSGIGWTATYTAITCSARDVASAISKASSGDTVLIPAGDCTWGASGTYLSVNKAITLQGTGNRETIIAIADTAGTYGSATIRISAAATVKNLTINGALNQGARTPLLGTGVNGWRVTNITFNVVAATWIIYADTYGLIDGNTINGGAGSPELIFVRGPLTSWQTAHSMGIGSYNNGADNVFIENNTFNESGYVTDCNSNSRCVVRFNTITAGMQIDGHGMASNGPPRSVRHMEIYNNYWSYGIGYWAALNFRGGTGRIFNNVVDGNPWLILEDHCVKAGYGYTNCGSVCKCVTDYPIDDQVGVGIDPKSGASEPLYMWNNTVNGSKTFNVTAYPMTAQCIAACPTTTQANVILKGRDYFNDVSKPEAMSGYTPYTCPHPLAGLTGTCDSTKAGTSGYSVTGPIPPRNLRIN